MAYQNQKRETMTYISMKKENIERRCKWAYELRVDTRGRWEDIAIVCGYKDFSSAMKGAISHAKNNNLPLPPLKMMSKSEHAYEDMVFGASIEEVTILHNFIAPWSTKDSLKQYAKNNNLPFPIEEHPMYKLKEEYAKEAYQVRLKERLSWSKIAYRVGFSDGSAAKKAAIEFGIQNNLQSLPEKMTQGERCYHLYCELNSWKEVRSVIRKPPEYCRNSAYRFAKKHSKNWPPSYQ